MHIAFRIFCTHITFFVFEFQLSLLPLRTAMWSMPVVLTETENENDSANQNDIAKMTLVNRPISHN